MANNQMPLFVNLADVAPAFTSLESSMETTLPPLCPAGMCDGSGCEGCYITSPAMYRPYSTSLDGPNTSHNGQYMVRPISTLEIPMVIPPSPPKRPLVQTNLPTIASQYPVNVLGHLDGQYAPGFIPVSGPVSIANSFSTPNTAVPSLAADDYSLPSPLEGRVSDFTGKGRAAVTFEYDTESWTAARALIRLVNEHGYMAQSTPNDGSGAAMTALHKSMSFVLREAIPGKVPPTVGHLQVILYYVMSCLNGGTNTRITPDILSLVLDQYQSQQSQQGNEFQLGIVSPSYMNGSYKVTIHRSSPYQVPTLWLYHSPESSDSHEVWSAIIPPDTQSGSSYAAAVRARPQSTPVAQRVLDASIDPSLLHPDAAFTQHIHAAVQSKGPARQHSPRVVRQQSSSTPGRGRGRGRHSTQASRATSLQRITEDKSHKCNYCDQSFLYPKDLTRHLPKHTKSKDFACPNCSKTFTRHDNMKRHAATAHRSS